MRKTNRVLPAIIGTAGLLAVCAAPALADPPNTGAWHQTFDDECNAAKVDSAKWNLLSGDTVINSPLTLNRWASVSEGGGFLRIAATAHADGTHRYQSAQISTQGKFAQQYGYFEARMRVPGGRYAWPAFWTLPTDGSWPPEIDILELNGSGWPNVAYQTYHYYDANNQWAQWQKAVDGSQAPWNVPLWGGGWAADWHTYGCEWDGVHLDWYIDGVRTASVYYYDLGVWVTNKPMYLILDLAIGGAWPGTPDGTETIPSYLDVDWVRAWSH